METVLIRLGPSTGSAQVDQAFIPPPNRAEAHGCTAERNLAAAFWQAAARSRRPAVVTESSRFLYADLQRAARHVQHYLLSRADFRPGSLVALQMENSPEYIAAFYGILLADGVVVPLPTQLERGRWEQIRGSCPLQCVLRREQDHSDAFPQPSAAFRIDGSQPTAWDEEFTEPRRHGEDLAMVLFTSGSTGAPKGVMLSHDNLLANARSILEFLPIRNDDRALVVLPFHHAFGNSILQTHVLAGATLVLGSPSPFPSSIPRMLRTFEATSVSTVPEIYSTWMRFVAPEELRVPSLRYMTVAGGALAPELTERLAEFIAPASFYVMYGQSEATARLSYLPPGEIRRRQGSIGRGIPGVELRVVNRQGDNVLPGRVGRLLARGPNIMLGYWQDPLSTSARLCDGWLDTGDLATVDEEGYIYLRGRANLLVKIQGYRVHPAEIEEVVRQCFPGIQSLVVPYPSEGAMRLALFLVPARQVPPTVEDVRRVLSGELPRHKVPSHVEILDKWPLNQALKVDRNVMGRWLVERERRAC